MKKKLFIIPLILSNLFLYFGLYKDKFFYLISFIFFSLFVYIFLDNILKNLKQNNKSIKEHKNKKEDEDFPETSAEEHPIIISARRRLGKDK